MSRPFSTERFFLGVATVASEAANPNAGAGVAGSAGSLWIRQGNAAGLPTQQYLNLDGQATGWQLQNLVDLSIYNVRAFGATGDGVTDDGPAINSAIAAAIASGFGGIIYFPPGTYRVTRPVTGVGSIVLSDAHDLVFMGDGFASQIAMIGSALAGDWYMFRIRNGTSRIKFMNLGFSSNITDKDPAEQNHFLNISGVAGDPLGGPHDIDAIGCYFGFIFGDGVRNLGEIGQVPHHISVLYNDFSMLGASSGSRSCVEAQRFTDTVNVSHNFCSGSNDQQIDFEPTAGDGPTNWTIVGNHVDASAGSTSAVTISGSTNTPVTGANRRMVMALNTFSPGAFISGVKGVVGADIVANITARIDITMRVQDCALVGNVCQTSVANDIGIRLDSDVSLSAPTDHDLVSDNVVVTFGNNFQGISITDTNDMMVSGNIVVCTNTVASASAGINATAATQDIDQLYVVGNMVIGLTNQMKSAFGFSGSGFNVRNCAANYNYIRNSLAIVFFNRTLAEQFLDWRATQGNNGVLVTGAPIQGIATLEGCTLEGNAGPGTQIAFIQFAAGPEGKVTAQVGSTGVNVVGVAGTVLWMKETGIGVSGGKTGWVQQGAVELSMGTQDAGTATATAFLAPGIGLATVSATEIQFTMTRAGTLRNLRLSCVAGVGAANVTYTVRRNNGNTALAVVVANTATTGTTATPTNVGLGDRISVSVARTAVVAQGQSEVVVTFELTA